MTSRKQGQQQAGEWKPKPNEVLLTFDLGVSAGAEVEREASGDEYHQALFKKLREGARALDLPMAALAMLACHWGIDKAIAKAQVEFDEAQARRRRAWVDGPAPSPAPRETAKAGAGEAKPGGRVA